MIRRLKNNAELAWASYFYFDFLKDSNNIPRKIYELDSKNDKIKDKSYPRGYKEIEITLEHIVSQRYKGQEVLINLQQGDDIFTKMKNEAKDSFNLDKLNGEFGEFQTKEFLKRYYLLDYYPKDDSKGFHACLFQDKESKEYTLAIRGSFDSKDYTTNFFHLFKDSTIPFDYLHTMILFYESCAKKYPAITQPKSLNVVGHSLGGCLAQIFALSFAKGSNKDSKPKDPNASTTESNQDSIINEVYTFNSPGAKNLKPPYDVIIYIPSITDNAMEKFLLHSLTETLKQEALALHLVIQENDFKQKVKEILNNTSNADTYLGINFYYNNNEQGTLNFNYEKVDKYFLSSYQTLIHNYNNRNKKGYKLGISDKVFHIESKNQADKYHHAKESYKENAAQHLGKDIEGNYFLLNLNFGGLDSHSITAITKLLYFYDYLYQINESLIDTTSKEVKIEYELHQDEFLKEHNEIDTQEYREHKKALEYCNRISLAINTILRNIEFQKALATSSSDDVYIPKTPNWLYAIIEQRVFEATIKTQQNKFLIKEDTSDIIEAILYLQQNKVYIQILEEDTIKNITPDSPLSQLFAIQESSFFISTDENTNPLIKDTHTANRLIGYRTPRAKIFCGHHKADTILVNCYKDVTLKHYPKAINE